MCIAVLPAPRIAKVRPGASALTVAMPLAASGASRTPQTAMPLPILIFLVHRNLGRDGEDVGA